MAAIAWLPWSAESFARARAERKPVLLSIAATWCRHCAAMDRTTFADGALAELVARGFVAVRVDADRRPDVSHRYMLGGLPTTAFLTPDGEMIGGGTFVEAERLAGMLLRVAGAFAEGLAAPPPAAVPLASSGRVPAPSSDLLVEQVWSTFDSVNGGFDGAPKFPHTAPVRLALQLASGDGGDRWREAAVRTLDAMGWGPLYDEQDGGFFRCAQREDWQEPQPEKLLDVNAALLSLYLDGFETLQFARYAERAGDVLRYLQTALADPVDGGWGASQGGDRAAIDPTLYVDWNARMASAALRAGQMMSDPGLSEFAILSLERVLLAAYRPGGGVAHHVEPQPAGAAPVHVAGRARAAAPVRGLLDDQVAMAVAQLDAFEATGNVVYEMMAEELALYAIRTMWDEEEGGFFDHAIEEGPEIGLLRARYKPFDGNCAAAGMLKRLAAATAKADYAGRARRTLEALSSRAPAEGVRAADYLLALNAPG